MISDLLAARSQMAMSLGFHIVFAALGIAMPVLTAVAEGRWLKTKDEQYRSLAKRWSKGTAILFAVGAVSGTVLSFELCRPARNIGHFAGEPAVGIRRPLSLSVLPVQFVQGRRALTPGTIQILRSPTRCPASG